MATTYPAVQTSVIPERRVWTLEQALYLLLALLSLFLHLYILGDRALHHDETLHAEYSWRIYVGQGYTHDPLLHGPFLYYWTAFVYFLFGDSDATARLSAALFGTVAVLLPALLRRELGRGAALLASAYLLVSPIFLYVGRFIRHDIFGVTFELLAVIALLRYMHSERPGWHYLFAAALGLMLATMETFYIFAVILGSYVVITLLWEVAPRAIALLVGYLALVGAAIKGLPALGLVGPLPLITEAQALEVRHQPDNNWGAYWDKLAAAVGPLLAHPSVLLSVLLTIGLAALLGWIVWIQRDAEGRSRWRTAADAAPRGSLLYAVDRVPRRQWLVALLIAFTIYAVFYTAILSNPGRPNTTGLVTGVLGSFLYWLGQHGVQRGNQPTHFYLFELAIYEPLLLIFGVAGGVLVLRRLLSRQRTRIRRGEDGQPIPPSRDGSRSAARYVARAARQDVFLPGFLVWWSVFALAIYSWAGEKMPWLTIHMVLPLALLAAWALGRIIAWALRDGVSSLTWALAGMASLLIVPSLLLLTITSADAQRANQAWFWPVLILAALGLMASGLTLLAGPRQGVLSLVGVTLVLLVPLTLRSSLRLSFVNGDVAVEPMVYVQTSPDVPRVMRQMEHVANLQGQHRDLQVRYDNETVWQWYLRNYRQTSGSGGQVLESIDDDVQVVLMLSENVQANEARLGDFVRQRYPLRWWFPECEVYRFASRDSFCGARPESSSLLGRFLRRPWSGPAVADMWQFWIFRRLPAPLGSSDWTLFVRPEIARHFGLGEDLD